MKTVTQTLPGHLRRPVMRAVLITLALACQAHTSLAQNRLPLQQAAASPTFVIQGFDITGDNPLPDGEATRILAPFLRADATIETLQKATAALEAALKERGFALHRVALPPQEVGKTVSLSIVKFVIGRVTVEGNSVYSEANIRASVPELKEGTSPNFRTMAVQTAIANESQSKRVQVALKESEEPDSIDARIVVKDSKPWNFAISANNTGSETTGRDRFTLSGGHANLFDLDHQFVAAYTTSLERASDVKQLGLNYRIPVYRWGGVVGASYTQSDVVGNFGTFNSTGAGRTFGLNYSHYLPPDGGYRGYLSLSLDNKQFDITQINGVALAGQQLRRSSPFTLGYNARMESDTSVWGYNAELAFNLPMGSGNDLSAYQSEDTRIQTAQWRLLRAGANYMSSFANGWLWGVRGNLQYTTQALIAGEQFGLGGSSSVRGTGERPMSGDSGMLLSAELTTKELAPGLRLLGFVDAGWLGNNATAGTARLDRDSLSSVGVGLRYGVSSFVITADYAQIVGGSQQAVVPNSTVPRAGDQKLHVNLSARF